MSNFSIQELACFDAVATEGSFQSAAAKLLRTHPTVYASVKRLEEQLGITLLDRSGYRVTLTKAGRAFHRRARIMLEEAQELQRFGTHLTMGNESDLTIVIGDLCPVSKIVALLRRFFDRSPETRLHLHFEALSGPWERLHDEEADLIIHHIEKSDQRLEYIELFPVHLIPVVAPGFLNFPLTRTITPAQMRKLPQSIIRDSARHSKPRDYFILDGTRSWTVADQLMKKELIVLGMGWGHMPTFLVESELRKGTLLSILGQHLQGNSLDIVAARLRGRPRGPVAERLWQFIAKQAETSHVRALGGRVTRRSRLAQVRPQAS